jgi:rhamnogalacturonan endolyase
MHDHTYRMGIAWQNTAYNQPPHLGYYLPDYIDGKLTNNVQFVVTESQQTKQVFDLQGRKLNSLKPGLNIIRVNGKTKKVFY